MDVEVDDDDDDDAGWTVWEVASASLAQNS